MISMGSSQGETECITIGASGSTRTPEVRDIVSAWLKRSVTA